MVSEQLQTNLRSVLSADSITDLQRLSGGANMEIWAFTAGHGEGAQSLILRRASSQAPGMGDLEGLVSEIRLSTEAALLTLAGRHAIPVPRVVRILTDYDHLGEGYVMTREPGEALPQRLFNDASLASVLPQLPYQCGATLARIHTVPLDEVPAAVPRRNYQATMEHFQRLLDALDNASPVLQLALNVLNERPPVEDRLVLCHGDFRNGNLLIDSQGLRAVLDWELAHVGHPWEDLGYFCANVWRFGRYDMPAGGFGSYQSLLDGYASVAGHAPSITELKQWELMAALNWGVVTQTMVAIYESGMDSRLERAAVGRRLSESEIDILLLLDELEAAQ